MTMWGTNMSARALTKIRDFLDNRWGQRNRYTMSKRFELQVHFAYDDEADVWYVAKSDIPGLSLEAASPAELLNRVAEAAPELIELNIGILTKVVDVRPSDTPAVAPAPIRKGKAKPRHWTVRPVFDAPLALACA